MKHVVQTISPLKIIILYLTLVFSLIPIISFSQQTDSCNKVLEGIILDIDTKKALPYVLIKVKDTPHFGYTDINGAFKIKGLCDENNQLIISCFGYCDTICKHFHQHQETPNIYLKEDIVTLDEVTVIFTSHINEGTESIPKERINKKNIEIDPTQSLGTVLSELSGVTAISVGNNVQLPVIHGLYGNRILILNEGLKHGFQNWGTDHAPEIDISQANSISVIKGASGVRYGPEAIGGAIIIENNPLYLNEPFSAKVSSGYHTNGKAYFINSQISHGLDKLSYYIGGNYYKSGDKHTPDYSLTNSGKQEQSINSGIRYHLENLDIKVKYSYISQNLAILRSSIAESGDSFSKAVTSTTPNFIRDFSYDINQPSQNTKHHFGKVETHWRYSEQGSLKLRIGSQLNQREEYDVRRTADIPIFDLDLITNDYQLEWQHPEWKKFKGLIGIQAFTQNNDNNSGTGTTPLIPNYNILRYSGFISEGIKKNKNMFEFGLRFDYEYNNIRGRETNQDIFRDEYTFTNLSSSLGYIRSISDNTTFRSNLGTAWRTPNMAELYSFGQNGFRYSYGLLRYYVNDENKLKTNRVTTLATSDIKPEKGYKWVNEYQNISKKNTLTITAYSHYIHDYIFSRPIAITGTIRGPMPVFITDQQNALFIGTDITWKKNISKRIIGTSGFSYLWSRNITKKEGLINQPPIRIDYKLIWKPKGFWKLKNIQFSAIPSYTFTQFQAPRTVTPDELITSSTTIDTESKIFDFKDVPNGFLLIDAYCRFEWKSLDFIFRVQNILNNRYRNYLNEMRYFSNELGRNFNFSISYNFKSKQKTK